MAGVFYDLQEDDARWLLRFTAREVSPGLAHALIEKMARSFCGAYLIPWPA